MISLQDYWMSRDQQYPLALSTEIRANAVRTVELANQLLERAVAAGFMPTLHPEHRSYLSSGWRPPAVNAAIPNAAVNSKHMTGQAVDVYDPHGDLDEWLLTAAGQQALKELGLWMEHPSATKGWSHVQTVPPRSGNRVFYP